jgi:hypothetical protein
MTSISGYRRYPFCPLKRSLSKGKGLRPSRVLFSRMTVPFIGRLARAVTLTIIPRLASIRGYGEDYGQMILRDSLAP